MEREVEVWLYKTSDKLFKWGRRGRKKEVRYSIGEIIPYIEGEFYLN